MQKYGLGHWQLMPLLQYLNSLNTRGLIGKGKLMECDLPLDKTDAPGYAKMLMDAIANRKGIGNDMTEGAARLAEKYGLLEDDLHKGITPFDLLGNPGTL